MDLFRILINRILRKIPLKLLLLIILFLLLALICFNAKSYASTSVDVYYEGQWISVSTNINLQNYVLLKSTYGNSSNYYLINSSTNTNFYISSTPVGATRNVYYIKNANGNSVTCDCYTFNGSTFTQTDWGQTSFKDNFANNNTPRTLTKVGGNKNVYITGNNGLTNSLGLMSDPFVNPYIQNVSEIEDLSFNNLIIWAGSEPYYRENDGQTTFPRIFKLEMDYQGVVYTMEINNYAVFGQNNLNDVAFAIPINQLFPQVVFRNSTEVSFSLFVQPSVHPNSTGDWSIYDLGTYALTLTTEHEQILQEDRQAQAIENMNQSINNVNTSVNNLNTSITDLSDSVTDSSVDDMSSTFSGLSSGFSVQDPSGLEQVFQKLYNAFCTDEVISVQLSVPFTNNTFTLSSNNISSRYPESVTSIVSVFVWGIIGLWVLKDIRTIVNKISEGKAEDVGSDVKKEVL